MEFPWKRSGQDSNVSVIPGSGSEGSASETRGDQRSADQMLRNPQTGALHRRYPQTGGRTYVRVRPSVIPSQTLSRYMMCVLHLRQRPEAFG